MSENVTKKLLKILALSIAIVTRVPSLVIRSGNVDLDFNLTIHIFVDTLGFLLGGLATSFS